MFILRKISGSGVEINISLGKSYTFISKESNPEEFKRVVDEGLILSDPIIYGFISYDFEGEGKGGMIGISSQQSNYIMTESGRTFDNISLK